MNIGSLTQQADGSFKGYIATLGLHAKITMRGADRMSDEAPSYRIYSGAGEAGAAWERTAADTGQFYLSLKLDCPTLGAPLYCAAFHNKDKPEDLDLVWSRSQPKD